MAGSLRPRKEAKVQTIVTATTGARIEVWREDELFHARLAGQNQQPEICVGMDLFEVIADLAGLDLEDQVEAAEATRLASEAQQRLGSRAGSDPAARSAFAGGWAESAWSSKM